MNSADSPQLIASSSLSLAAARAVLAAAESHANRIGVAVCVCISDPAGEPILRVRMDTAPRLSASLAENKAWTVTQFLGMPTHAWWSVIENDPSLVHGITQTPRLIVFGGGVAVTSGGAVVGAIGVSGGSAEQDREIAEAGAAAIS